MNAILTKLVTACLCIWSLGIAAEKTSHTPIEKKLNKSEPRSVYTKTKDVKSSESSSFIDVDKVKASIKSKKAKAAKLDNDKAAKSEMVKSDKLKAAKSEMIRSEKIQAYKSEKMKAYKSEKIRSEKVKAYKSEQIRSEKIQSYKSEKIRSEKVKLLNQSRLNLKS